MRVSVFCCALLLTSLQLLAVKVSHAQNINETTITYGVKDVSLSSAIKRLEEKTGYTFFYPSEKVAAYNNISIVTKSRTVGETITLLLNNTDLDFKQQNDNNVLIFLKSKTLNKPALNFVVRAKVVDQNGQAIPGVNVKAKGLNLNWATDEKGIFAAVITTPDVVLQFSFIGYITQEFPAEQLKTEQLIVLKEDISKLNEVQVIGYGTTTKRANTGDVSVVTAKTIGQYPTTNVLDALQGSVNGLSINKNSGNSTGTYKVLIRGINGLSGGSPLYVIDGVPIQGGGYDSRNSTSGSNSAGGSNLGGFAYDALSLINPDDIESVSILKDADATAIYGSRGADGVILITTKKGKIGAVKVDASIYSGVSEVGHFQPMLNTQQYLQMRHEAKNNDKAAISTTDYDMNGVWDTTRNTNWQKALIGGYGHNTKAQVGISGGSELMQFRISSGYNYASSLESLSGSDRTANLNFNLNSSTRNKKFSISFNGGYLYKINTIPQVDFTGYTALAPDAPALYTSTGALNFQNNTFSNPLVSKNYINSTPLTNLTSSLILSYKPINDLEIKLSSGYNKQSINEFLGIPTTVVPPYQTISSSSSFTYDNASAWSIEPQINYTKKIGKGNFLATVGGSLQDQTYSSLSLKVTGYSSDLLLNSPTGGTTITPYSGYIVSPRKFAALFGRVNYSWSDKYFVDLTFRDDGSSNFGQNKQYHVFTAAGAGWIFSEESLIKDNLSFLSFGKLRGSYGTTGRDNINPYSYLSTYSGNNSAVAYGGVAGLIPTGLPNPDLSWETTRKAELGLELQFLKGRISFETNFYRNRTTGILAGSLLSVVTGFSSITSNLPSTVQNQGFDASLTTVNFKNKDFSWATTILFTRDRNKLVEYPNLGTSAYANLLIVGQPVNIVKTYRFGGVNPQTGVYQIYGANGSIVATPSPTTDKNVLINVNPDFYGSLQNSFSYKQFALNFLFRFVKQTGRNAFYNIGSLPPGIVANNNFPTLVLDRWQKPGDVTNIQRYGTNFNLLTPHSYAIQSNAAYGDASFIRLQNLSLSYTLPQTISRRLGMQNLQVYVEGSNLWTITGYDGLDPETQSNLSLPPLKILTAGLRLTL